MLLGAVGEVPAEAAGQTLTARQAQGHAVVQAARSVSDHAGTCRAPQSSCLARPPTPKDAGAPLPPLTTPLLLPTSCGSHLPTLTYGSRQQQVGYRGPEDGHQGALGDGHGRIVSEGGAERSKAAFQGPPGMVLAHPNFLPIQFPVLRSANSRGDGENLPSDHPKCWPQPRCRLPTERKWKTS